MNGVFGEANGETWDFMEIRNEIHLNVVNPDL